jgi:hypothetical protein
MRQFSALQTVEREEGGPNVADTFRAYGVIRDRGAIL